VEVAGYAATAPMANVLQIKTVLLSPHSTKERQLHANQFPAHAVEQVGSAMTTVTGLAQLDRSVLVVVQVSIKAQATHAIRFHALAPDPHGLAMITQTVNVHQTNNVRLEAHRFIKVLRANRLHVAVAAQVGPAVTTPTVSVRLASNVLPVELPSTRVMHRANR
jgi:hypothetical protein